MLDYGQYGKCLYKPKLSWSENTTREDIILFDEADHTSELTKNLKFDDSVDAATRATLISIVKEYWDCFVKTGAKRTVLRYEFGIDTGGEKLVCYLKPLYGPNETKVIMQQVSQLLGNTKIEPCDGPWGSIIVLAQKPHQENVTHVEDFVWCMYVSYRCLNAITKPFQFPIPRCDDAIIILGGYAGNIWMISIDARQGYH